MSASAPRPARDVVRGLAIALWAVALVVVGGLVAPTLFRVLPERSLAGLVAGDLFRQLTWLSIPAAAIAFGLHARVAVGPVRARHWALVPAALLLVNEYALRPIMDAQRAAGRVTAAFMAWHGVSAALYAVATLVAVALLVRELRNTR